MIHQFAKLTLAIGLLSILALAQSAPESRDAWVRPGGVVHGDPGTSQSPAQMDYDKVWNSIYEIRRIERERPGPAFRDILLTQAHARLQAALKAEMEENRYDCIVRTGSIIGDPPFDVPDITRALIARVRRP